MARTRVDVDISLAAKQGDRFKAPKEKRGNVQHSRRSKRQANEYICMPPRRVKNERDFLKVVSATFSEYLISAAVIGNPRIQMAEGANFKMAQTSSPTPQVRKLIYR